MLSNLILQILSVYWMLMMMWLSIQSFKECLINSLLKMSSKVTLDWKKLIKNQIPEWKCICDINRYLTFYLWKETDVCVVKQISCIFGHAVTAYTVLA